MSLKYKDMQQIRNPLTTLNLRFRGIWDMQEFYEGVIQWLLGKKYKFYEKVYKHKHPSPFGVERQYVWSAEQFIDGFIHVIIDIYMHTYDAHEITVETPTGKKLMTEGKIWAVLRIHYKIEHEDRFMESSFWGNLKDFAGKYLWYRRMEAAGWSQRFRNELVQLHGYMMQKLQMSNNNAIYADYTGVHRRSVV